MIYKYKNIVVYIKSNPILYRLAHGSCWVLLGTVTARGFSVLATIVIARILGIEDFGAYGMVQSTLAMFGLFAGFSLGTTSSKYLAEYKEKDKKKAGRILSLTNSFASISSGIIGLGIYLSSSWIAKQTLNRIDLAPLLSLGALYLFISTQNNIQAGSLGGFEAFKEIAQINSIQGILTPVVAIPLVYYSNLYGAIISLIVISLISYVLCRNVINRKCREFNIDVKLFDRSSFKEWPIIWHFSIPSLASGLLVMPVMWFTNAILVNQPNGYPELGLFNAANQWRQLIIFIPQIISVVMLPILSEAYSDEKRERFSYALKINMIITWIIALPMTILIIVFREPLALVFGKGYAGMGLLMVILMVTSFLNILSAVIGTALAGSGKMWIGATMNIGWATAIILFAFCLVPVYGGLGLAIAYLLSYAMHTCWVMVYTDKYLAPRLIRDQKGLICMTAITIIPLLILAFLDELKIVYTITILLLSIMPCGRLLKEQYKKFNIPRIIREA